MSELRELYQQVILDHNKNPHYFGKLEKASCCQDGNNPLCGDYLRVCLRLVEDYIEDIRFEGHGCAISKASASLMTTMIKGRSKTEALALFDCFHEMITAPIDTPFNKIKLGKLIVFSGVREFPMRVKCAVLAWHTMKAALTNHDRPISTE